MNTWERLIDWSGPPHSSASWPSCLQSRFTFSIGMVRLYGRNLPLHRRWPRTGRRLDERSLSVVLETRSLCSDIFRARRATPERQLTLEMSGHRAFLTEWVCMRYNKVTIWKCGPRKKPRHMLGALGACLEIYCFAFQNLPSQLV